MKRRTFLQTIFGLPLLGATPVALPAMRQNDLILPPEIANRNWVRLHVSSFNAADFEEVMAKNFSEIPFGRGREE